MSIRIRTVVNKFLKWAEKCMAPATVAAYRHQLAKFVKQVPNKLVTRLQPADLTAWAKSWHEFQAIIRALNWATVHAGIVRRNPFAKLKLPGRGCRRRILSPGELTKFVRRARPAARAFLLALRETFARPQEIRHADWNQLQTQTPGMPIDEALVTGQALIVQHDFKDCRRRRDQTRPRVLLISPRLGRLIVRLARRQTVRSGAIFKNSVGNAWTKNAVRCLLRRLRRGLGFARDGRGENVTAYTLRHSLATWAAAAGVRDRTLADLLGHVETRTTSRYLHLQVGHLRDAMSRLIAERRKGRQEDNRKL